MERCKSIKIEKGSKFIKIEKGSRSIKIDKYGGGGIKMEVLLDDLEMINESKTCIDQLKREIRCLTRANTSAEIGNEMWKKNYKEMESKYLMLKDYSSGLLALIEEKTRECAGLEERLNEFRRSRNDVVVVDGEPKGLEIVCSSSKVTELEEGNGSMRGKDKDGGELSLCLWNANDKCVQLERKNKELELEKSRLEENQALVCEREVMALSRIADLCEEIQKLRSEKQDVISTYMIEKNELSSRKDVVDNALNGLEIECSKLKERVAQLEERNRVLCEKEKNGEEQIVCLPNVEDKCELLQNRDLELAKDELSSKKDIAGSELNGLKIQCIKLKERVTQLEEENRVLCEKEKYAQEQILCLPNVTENCEVLQRQNNELVLEKNEGGKSSPIHIESDDEDEHLVSCKKECPLSSTPKRKRVAEVGAGEIKTEDGQKKFNAEQNVLLERLSREMQTPTVPSQSQSICENKGWHERTSHVLGIHCKESKWIDRTDLYLSLTKDPELCLKAICALCRQQASTKKPQQDSPGYGFFQFDEVRGMELGKLLMDGNMSGDLKKSVEQLEQMDSSLLEECKTLALDHSYQLFNIYQAKEDPFFSE